MSWSVYNKMRIKNSRFAHFLYAVHSEDEDGTVYECKIMPFRKSDKDLLQMLLNKKSA